jgi:hypothetical protein
VSAIVAPAAIMKSRRFICRALPQTSKHKYTKQTRERLNLQALLFSCLTAGKWLK